MKNLKTTMLALLCCAAITTKAYDYPYLTFQNADETETSVAAENLTLIFSGGKLLATNAAGTQTFTLATLKKMYFSQTPTAVGNIRATGEQTEGEVEAYSLTGVRMGRFASKGEAAKQLGQGIYIIKDEGINAKIAVR